MVKKTKKKLSEEEKGELAAEGELPKKSVMKSEDRQLAWVVAIIVVIFVVTVGTYYWVEGAKTFEFGKVEWAYEKDVDYYHGRFANLFGGDYIYNIYLRNDPRKNDVPTEGAFDKFKRGVIISTSPEFDLCRGDASKVMSDLGGFMMEGFARGSAGAGPVKAGSTNEEIAIESERIFATCDNIDDRTILIIDRGNNFVDQDDDNLNCYTIYVEDCNDASPVEKFMLKVINDFGD